MWGYRQGLIVGAMTLVGFGLGALAGSRLGPLILSKGSESPYAPLCAALGALLAGALVAVAVESFALGLRAKVIRRQALHLADGAGGAALIASVALGLAWVFGSVALHAPGTARLRADVQESVILRSLNEVLPPSGPVLNALDRVDPAPSVTGPAAPVARPDEAIATDPDVLGAGERGRARARHRLRARGRGLRLGGAARPDRHQRPCAGRLRRHHGDDPERGGAGRDARLLRTGGRPGAAAGRGRPAHPADCRAARAGRRRRRPRLSRERPLRGDAGAPRRDSADDQRGLLRQRAGRPHDRRRCAARCAAATRAGRWSTTGDGPSAPSSPPPPPAPPAASRSLPRTCATPSPGPGHRFPPAHVRGEGPIAYVQ